MLAGCIGSCRSTSDPMRPKGRCCRPTKCVSEHGVFCLAKLSYGNDDKAVDAISYPILGTHSRTFLMFAPDLMLGFAFCNQCERCILLFGKAAPRHRERWRTGKTMELNQARSAYNDELDCIRKALQFCQSTMASTPEESDNARRQESQRKVDTHYIHL